MTELWVVGDRGHEAGPCESERAAEATRIWGEYVYAPERFRVVERPVVVRIDGEET